MRYLVVLLCAFIGYLIGSVNFGVLISKVFYNKDIRDYGSKNAGMTNMLRTFGKKAALFTFLGDFIKGAIAVIIGKYLLSNFLCCMDSVVCGYMAGIFSMIGHMFPLFFGFKGGKGVATAFGITAFIAPWTIPMVIIPFIFIALVSKYISLATLISAILWPFATFISFKFISVQPPFNATVFTAVMSFVIIIMHRENIKRLLKGKENKFNLHKNKTK